MEFETKIFRNNFRFIADRYEEWQAGQCISSGPIGTIVNAVVKGDYIHFTLEGKEELRILDSFSLHCKEPHAIVLHDRVQYVQATHDMNPIVPIICHLFYEGDNIEYVRFGMTNPDRLIEFYGTLEDLGQYGTPGSKPISEACTAEDILKELRNNKTETVAALNQRAEDLFNTASPKTIEGKKTIAEALKLFVEALRLEREELNNIECDNDNDREENCSIASAKLLSMISLCNLYIGNYNSAYHLAKKGLDELKYAMDHSVIQGFTGDMFGEDIMISVLRVIEKKKIDEVDLSIDYYDIDELEIDLVELKHTVNLQAFEYNFNAGTDKDAIVKLIELVRALGHERFKHANKHNYGEHLGAIMGTYNMLENVLFFCWETLGYGNHYDFWEEGDSMFEYMLFSLSPRETLQQVVNVLKGNDSDDVLVIPSAQSRMMSIIIKTLNRM